MVRDMYRLQPPTIRREKTYTDGGKADIAGVFTE